MELSNDAWKYIFVYPVVAESPSFNDGDESGLV